jgi:peptidoglycan hydrolase CwlO-like protein
MKKILITMMLVLSSVLAFSQTDYPRIETDSLGKKVVVMTIEQAQKIDNNLEILQLMEKAQLECDSLNMSYIRVIDNQGKQISLLELDIKHLKEQLNSKDEQITNIQTRLSNSETTNKLCEEQKLNYEKQVDILTDEVRKQKNHKIVGFIVGGVGTLGGILLAILLN